MKFAASAAADATPCRCFAVIDENGDIVRMKRVPKLASVNASVDAEAGVMLLSCPSCEPSVIAIPLRDSIDSQSIAKTACLVASTHEELRFGHVCRKVMTDARLRSFFWQATGRTLYIARQLHSSDTFSNDGQLLLCATASLHKVCALCFYVLTVMLFARSCTRGRTTARFSLEWSSSGPTL